jgi:hypothetical protein
MIKVMHVDNVLAVFEVFISSFSFFWLHVFKKIIRLLAFVYFSTPMIYSTCVRGFSTYLTYLTCASLWESGS